MQLYLLCRCVYYALAHHMSCNREYPCCYHQLHASPQPSAPLPTPMLPFEPLYYQLPPVKGSPPSVYASFFSYYVQLKLH
jgi:hypothetical protein